MKRKSGELELQVLQALATIGTGSVADILSELDQAYAYTTIMTILNRLHEKNEVERKKEGRSFTYRLPEGKLVSRLKRLIFGHRSSALISYLIETDDEMTDKELAEINRLIAEKRGRQ